MLSHPSRGNGSGSFISGRSVHNCRIERLWRDVYEAILSSFYGLFYHMEDINILLVDSETHLFCLYFVFLARINYLLGQFVSMWNNHKLRTEGNRSPLQLFISGLHAVANQSSIIPNEYFTDNTEDYTTYGVDDSAPLPVQSEGDVVVAPVQVFLQPENINLIKVTLQAEFPNLHEDVWDYQPYIRCCELVQHMLDN